MNAARYGHAVALLPTGKVLVFGGRFEIWNSSEYSDTPLDTAELYDPGIGTWQYASNYSASSSSIGATTGEAVVLITGKVLWPGSQSDVAELYDPMTNTWTKTGALNTPRIFYQAIVLQSGKVLVAGGYAGSSGTATPTAEVYDPTTGQWTATGTMTFDALNSSLVLLQSGKVLAFNGHFSNTNYTGAELYDPDAGTWTRTGTMHAGHNQGTATLLPSGQVLVAGGIDTNATSSASTSSTELFDPATGAWTLTGSLAQARNAHSAVLLPSGKVLVIGGYIANTGITLSSVESYDPASGLWSQAEPLHTARDDFSTTVLPSGVVLVAGGELGVSPEPNFSTSASTELYNDVIFADGFQ